MKWFGVTGGIGSGKTTVCKLLKSLGWEVVDADEIVHNLIANNELVYNEIVNHFGKGVLSKDGDVDRKKLGQIVFKEKDQLLQLEAILHPRVQEVVQKLKLDFEKQKLEMAFYDVPLLFEKNLQSQFDGTLVVSCSRENQILRVQKRSGMSREKIMDVINHQLPMSQKVALADFVIENDGDEKSLSNQVKKTVEKMKNHQPQE